MLMSYYQGYDRYTVREPLRGFCRMTAPDKPGMGAGRVKRKESNNMENTMKQELKICQSCGMPMQEDQYGTNQDGSRNEKYCCYCYKDGAFAQDCSLEEMIDFCAPFEVEGGRAKTVEEAKGMLRDYFPTLERWRA